MTDTKKVIRMLNNTLRHCHNLYNHVTSEEQTWLAEINQGAKEALELLKAQEKQKFFVDESGKITPLPEIVRCKDCKNWIAGYITDQDDFIPSKCGKYQQMVGHSSDDFCSLAERRAEWDESER